MIDRCLVAGLALTVTACMHEPMGGGASAPTASSGEILPPTEVVLVNVRYADGASEAQAMVPEWNSEQSMRVDNWRDGVGFDPWSPPSGRGPCGAPVLVTSSDGRQIHGRLLIRHRLAVGTGPAEQGRYRVEVPDSRIEATSGGRRAVATEMYEVPPVVADNTDLSQFSEPNNAAYQKWPVAWTIFLSETPLHCGGT